MAVSTVDPDFVALVFERGDTKSTVRISLRMICWMTSRNYTSHRVVVFDTVARDRRKALFVDGSIDPIGDERVGPPFQGLALVSRIR